MEGDSWRKERKEEKQTQEETGIVYASELAVKSCDAVYNKLMKKIAVRIIL